MKYPFLFVALDYETLEEVMRTAEQLASTEGNFGFKINLNIMLKHGVKAAIDPLKKFGKPIFADVKMFLGERTMVWIVEDLANLGVEFINIHLFAGFKAVKTVNDALKKVENNKTGLLGLTVPTHYDTVYCQDNFGKTLIEMVVSLARVAAEADCKGIILPPSTLRADTHGFGDVYGNMLRVVPAIRIRDLPGFNDKRHSDAVIPKEALINGADILVCGTPITKSQNMRDALKRVLEEMH